ncbi:MAG: hypothetical protein ACK4GT_00710 [Pararhodobacter sp.]
MDTLLMMAIATIPLGMLAVIGLPSVGGLSLLAANLAAACLAFSGFLLLLTRLIRGQTVQIEPASIALGLFALYAVFSATILVRLFAGEMMVFSLARGVQGVRVSTEFAWGKVWLGPSSTNISQTFYVVLSFCFFVAATWVLQRRGAAFGERCLVVAAIVNLVLGTLDAMGLDPLLEIIRTANYSLMDTATVSGLRRIIGGFPEASSFGGVTSVFFAYFASAYLGSGRPRDALLALASFGFAVFALSSTGLLALGVICLLLFVRVLSGIGATAAQTAVLIWTVALTAIACALGYLVVFTDVADVVVEIIDRLIFNKSGTSSGSERSAWALGGLEALRDSYGLGVGTGSLRSNGIFFVLLGSVGIVGTACFLVFLWLAFGGTTRPADAAILANARTAAAAVLVGQMLSATVPDPGMSLVFLAAIACAAKRSSGALAGRGGGGPEYSRPEPSRPEPGPEPLSPYAQHPEQRRPSSGAPHTI